MHLFSSLAIWTFPLLFHFLSFSSACFFIFFTSSISCSNWSSSDFADFIQVSSYAFFFMLLSFFFVNPTLFSFFLLCSIDFYHFLLMPLDICKMSTLKPIVDVTSNSIDWIALKIWLMLPSKSESPDFVSISIMCKQNPSTFGSEDGIPRDEVELSSWILDSPK